MQKINAILMNPFRDTISVARKSSSTNFIRDNVPVGYQLLNPIRDGILVRDIGEIIITKSL